MSDRAGRARRFLRRTARHGGRGAAPASSGPREPDSRATETEAGWNAPAVAPDPVAGPADTPPLAARVLALFGDPRIDGLTARTAAGLLRADADEVETTLEALVAQGTLHAEGDAIRRYVAPPATKERLESMFRDTAVSMGATTALAERPDADALALVDDDEPRLPVTAGLLSLFLPGTGQLLNGDVGRASLVFAVWSLAWITHLSPIWSFVCLYAGAEAFFTAKIRGMERRLAREAAAKARGDALARSLPAKPT
ncbi:MAG: hypothetical protein D6705_01820 [Deltaproteobacteria bacterium]|nr:MAG: hypothetical protein D6705_01820 [Deltaproteobacteria bacterium]